MKINNLLSLFIFSLFLLSLSASAKKASDITISFTILDKKTEAVEVMLQEVDTMVQVDTEGKASITLPLKEAMYGMVKYKFRRNVIYAEPGINIDVTYDMGPRGLTATFAGKTANKNNFINSKKVELPKMGDFSKEEDDVLDLLEEYQDAGYKAIEAEHFDDAFAAKERIRIDYEIYGFLWQYAAKRSCTQETFDKLKSLERNDPWLTQLSVYLNYMDGAAGILGNGDKVLENRGRVAYALNKVKYAIDNYTNPETRDYTIYSSASAHMQQYGADGAEELKALWTANLSNQEAKAMLDAIYEEQLKSGKGAMSPDFKMTDINGKEYTLADFKGKVVFIDLWATWCVPCRQEIPHLKKLEKDFQGSNICFVGMSIDRDADRKKWEQFVYDNQMPGIQLFAGSENSFINAYEVNAIPRFILIDKEGRIIDANMSRPSDPQTFNRLTDLAE